MTTSVAVRAGVSVVTVVVLVTTLVTICVVALLEGFAVDAGALVDVRN